MNANVQNGLQLFNNPQFGNIRALEIIVKNLVYLKVRHIFAMRQFLINYSCGIFCAQKAGLKYFGKYPVSYSSARLIRGCRRLRGILPFFIFK